MPSWSYVCRPCLARARALANASTSTGRIASRHLIRLYSLPTKLYDPAENQHLLWQDKPRRGVDIRDYLRQWEIDTNAGGSETLPVDLPPEGDLTNNITRTQATGAQGLITIASRDAELSLPMLGEGHHEDVASASESRIPGNLVELRSAGSRISNLAIYLGSFGGCNHFYSAEGTWLLSMSFPTAFTVTRFIPFDDLRPVLSKIPERATPEEYFEMQAKAQGPSREDGEILMDRMAIFRTDANLVYSRHIAEFEKIQSIVHRSFNVEYISLVEAAERLLPLFLRQDDGSFPSHVLYAVHRALGSQEIGCTLFNSSSDCRRPDHLYEVLPPNYAENVDRVAAMVRQYVDEVMSRKQPVVLDIPQNVHMLTNPLLSFVKEAREAVMESRRRRSLSPYGILAPSSGVELAKTPLSTTTRQVILFLEWWSSYGYFAPGSRLHSYGALILRALNLYPDRDLGQSTAWLFLQELGIINPWEIPSRYKVRLPGVSIDKDKGLVRAIPVVLEDSMRPDVAAGHRMETPSKTVFCIDAASTTLIDDGISLERTEWPNEFWVHIHVADPASRIKPDSELSKFAELVPENIYLPGHFEPMIPGDLGRKPEDTTSESLVKQFSLRTGAPSLTFSARVNRAGDIVESKITPCTLGDVVFLEPEDVAEFCDEPPPPPDPAVHSRLAVGTPNADSQFPPRNMSRTSNLTKAEKDDLLTLYQLAEAVRQKRLSKGAWPHFFPKPSVTVDHGTMTGKTSSSEGVKIVPADPYIEVDVNSFTGCSVVSNLMVLAGEVAARWCSSRGIPIPYRKNTKAASRFEDAYEYATEVLYPLVRRGIRPTMRQRDELQKLTGEVDMSSRPGPYFLMGLDMYTKATSPLRRFSDLLVHWQIHGALAYEREAGRSLDPAKDELTSILPFTASGLKLPWLKMREKTGRRMASGSLDWILIAMVRAWRFEGKDLGRLTFRVSSKWTRGLIGRLGLFNLPARLDAEFLDGCRLLKESAIGDEYEVELCDVCVHGRTVFVKALRYLGNHDQPGV
ncbi:hypothetical protein CP533_4581 [Ophiocordyceps camponoti-saundersi (nom. inval.)]|nr:hypothetical protein CP533_4581 [Ophiocordyceps camponoti-saundersi (nom. inval.)]